MRRRHNSWSNSRVQGRRGRSATATIVLVVVAMFAAMLAVAPAPVAAVESGFFDDGTELEVDITSPLDGSPAPGGEVTLAGTARVGGGDTVADTAVVVAMDASNSTTAFAGVDCDGDGSIDRIFDCEIAGIEEFFAGAREVGSVAEIAVIRFSGTASLVDTAPFSTAPGTQTFTAPDADVNANGIFDLSEALDTINRSNGTRYDRPAALACQTLAASSQPNKYVVFLSDGENVSSSPNVSTVLPCATDPSVPFYTFAVGTGARCDLGSAGPRGSLQDVADLTGGTCTDVADASDLRAVLDDLVRPEITALHLSVNGGPPVDISADATPALPAPGPQEVSYTRAVTGLAGPVDELCVTATGQRGDEEITVTDCVEVVSNQAPVADAGDDFSTGEGGVVTVDGSGSFDPDSDPLTYTWTLVDQNGPPIVLTATSTSTLAFQAPDDGTYTFELTVSDGRETSTDQATVTVTNTAPTVEVSTEPAAEGGVALLTASHVDPGFVDTHTATIDWGDGTAPEVVPVAAQGTGWGTVVASHIYPTGGGYTATVTVTDDDGGTSTATEGQVGVTAPLAIWANRQGGTKTLWVSGSDTTITGRSHTNGELRVTGSKKTFTGPTTYAGGTFVTGSNNTFTPPAAATPVEQPPVILVLADYQPGGRAATDAGAAFFDMSSACGNRWQPSGPLSPGLYWVPCDVKVSGSQFTAGAVTIAAAGEIQVSGSAQQFFEPFIDGALFVSGKTGNNVIQVSGSQSLFTGYLHALGGEIQISGSGHQFFCGIIADTVKISGSGTNVSAADCARPARTTADPSLVPALGVTVAQTPAEVFGGGDLADDIGVTNDGAVVLIPGIVGIQNLDAAASTTVTGGTVGIERFDITTGAWTPIAAPVSVATRPNPTPGVAHPAGGGFAATQLAAGGYATWATQAQATLTPAQVDQLLDPALTGGVRVVADLATDPAVPVRQLTRFSSDVGPALRAQGATVTDVAVTVITADGNAEIVTAADNPDLASLAPGATVDLNAAATVPAVEPPGVTETAAAYAERLAALDNTALTAIGSATGTGGVGLIAAPQATATSTRRVPALAPTMLAEDTAVAGDDLGWLIGATNISTTPAEAIAVTGDIDGDPATVDGIPTSLPAGGVATGAMTTTVPPDHPGGELDAATTYTWSDQAGNTYGPVTLETTTIIGTAASLKASLADTIAIDADGNGLPSPGDTIAYTATVTNRGDNPATAVTATIPTDPNSTLVPGSATTNLGTATTGNAPGDTTVTVDIGTIGAHTSAEIAFQVVAANPMPTGVSKLTAQGTIVSGAPGGEVVTDDPGVFGTDNPTVTQLVLPNPAVDVTLADTLAVDPDSNGPDPGDTIRYQAAVVSVGNAAVTDATVTLNPGANTTLVAETVTTDTGTVTIGNTPGDITVAVDLGTLAPGAEVFVTFDVAIGDPPEALAAVTNQATVTATNLTAPVLSDDPATPALGDATETALGSGTGDPADTGPDIGDCTPAEGTAITEPTTVSCAITPRPDTTATDWEITLTRADGEGEHRIATGTGPDVEGTIDPTIISNGTWIAEITVRDDDNGTSTHEIGVVVEGQLKLGRYHITYQDLAVPVGGLPIQVLRTYDTLNRTIDGDFGHGWSLDVADFRVDVHRPLGEGGWEQYQCGGGFIIVNYCFETSRSHYVTVTWPDGRVETFDFTPQGLSSFYGAGAIARYTGRPAATSELRPVAGDTNLGWTGTGDLWDDPFDPGDPYDPQRFVLVAKDGTRYTLDRTDGLVEARDRNGNTITVDDTGIRSSSGPSIEFDRDTDGRITTVTGPDNESVSYTYTPDGDLESVTDQRGKVSAYEYGEGHRLASIDDPGPGVWQQLGYDPVTGRLVSVTDAAGNTTSLSVDAGTRTEVVTSPDGREIVATSFDERGNPTAEQVAYDGRSEVTSWEWTTDGLDRPLRRVDAAGGVWSATYNNQGDLLSFTEPANQAAGLSTVVTYDEFGAPTTVTDPSGETVSMTYDDRGNVEVLTGPGSISSSFEYDTRGRLTASIDPLDRRTTYEHTPQGWVASQRSPLGRTTSYEYDAMGRPTLVTAPGARSTSMDYDAAGNLTRRVSPGGIATSWTYDDRGLLATATDPDDHVTSYGYDELGRLDSIVYPDGSTSSMTHDWRGNVLTSTDQTGLVTTSSYDGRGRLTAVTMPTGRVTSYGYDPLGRVVSMTSPGRGTSSWGYDPSGRVVSVTNGEAETSTTVYDALGRVIESTDPLGRVSTVAYLDAGRTIDATNAEGATVRTVSDAAGQLRTRTVGISASNPTGSTTTYGYDADGRAVTKTDPTGRTWRTIYDPAGFVTGIEGPDNATATYGYDTAGRRTSATSASGVSIEYRYDERGNLTRAFDELGNETTWTYDEVGRVIASTNAEGHPTTFDYDAAGRLLQVADALDGTVGYGWTDGRPASVTDPGGGTTTYSYGPNGDLGSITDPLGRSTSLTWDRAGRMSTLTDPRDLTTTYTYNNAGELTTETREEPLGSPTVIDFAYDLVGQLESMSDPTGTTTWTRDDHGRVTGVASPAGAITYGYDPAGRRTSMGTPDGAVTYSYDPAGRLRSISEPGLPGSLFELSYLDDGRVQSMERPNGVATEYGYDPAGRLERLLHTGPDGDLAEFSYDLNGVGSRVGLTATTPDGATTETYTLDALERIVAATYGTDLSETYTYDAAGNRTSTVRTDGESSSATNYTFDAAQQLTSVEVDGSTTVVSHDESGNIEAVGAETYTWNAAGQMVASDTTGGAAQTYEFDGSGLRVSVDGQPQLWDRIGGVADLVRSGDDAVVSTGGRPLATYSPDGPNYLLGDALGSTRVVTDATGSVTAAADYDVWGTPRDSGSAPRFGFTGQQTDASGLVHLRARQYSPELGRFLSGDTLIPNGGGTQGYGAYTYALGNPTTMWDPSGHAAIAEYNTSLEAKTRTTGATTYVGLCAKGILEGVAYSIAVAPVSGGVTISGWDLALDCGLEVAFVGVPGTETIGSPTAPRPTRPGQPGGGGPRPSPNPGGGPDSPPRPGSPEAPSPHSPPREAPEPNPKQPPAPRPPIPAPPIAPESGPGPAPEGGPETPPLPQPGPEPTDSPPDDDDFGPDCSASEARVLEPLWDATWDTYFTLYNDPYGAKTKLGGSRIDALERTHGGLTRPFFGQLMHEGVAQATRDFLWYVGAGNYYADFLDYAQLECEYEVTTDDPATIDSHVARGIDPGRVVTYPSLDTAWRFMP